MEEIGDFDSTRRIRNWHRMADVVAAHIYSHSHCVDSRLDPHEVRVPLDELHHGPIAEMVFRGRYDWSDSAVCLTSST